MALSKELASMFNEQINHELYSAYLYSTFCDYYQQAGLRGYANWYDIQVQEEMSHAAMFRQYLLDNDVCPKMLAIDEPDKSFTTPLEPLEAGYAHECYITATINDLYAQAHKEHDFRAMQFLDYFIKEQMEEEVNAQDMIQDYKNFGKSGEGLYALDEKYASRTFTAPSASSAE